MSAARLLPTIAAAALGAMLSAPAAAQTQAPPDPPTTSGDRVTIAVGAASLPDYEGADSNSWTPGAAVIGEVAGHSFFTRGTQLYVDLLPDAPGPGVHIELGVIAGARLERTGKPDDYDRDDIGSQIVARLGKVDTAIEVGGFVGVSKQGVITSEFDTLTARVAFVHDVADAYGSYVITPQINYATPLSRGTLVSFGASADYVGKGYGRTYFSVTPAQALASGLRVYDASDDGFKRFNLSAFAIQSLSGNLLRGLGVGAGVVYGRLLGRYKDSPIVRDVGAADQWLFAAGLTYTF